METLNRELRLTQDACQRLKSQVCKILISSFSFSHISEFKPLIKPYSLTMFCKKLVHF